MFIVSWELYLGGYLNLIICFEIDILRNSSQNIITFLNSWFQFPSNIRKDLIYIFPFFFQRFFPKSYEFAIYSKVAVKGIRTLFNRVAVSMNGLTIPSTSAYEACQLVAHEQQGSSRTLHRCRGVHLFQGVITLHKGSSSLASRYTGRQVGPV